MRKNWKTKNFDPESNPLLEESSTDEEEYGSEYEEEVEDISPSKQGIDEDEEYENPDSMSFMQREAIKANKENRQSKSAHPKMRGKN